MKYFVQQKHETVKISFLNQCCIYFTDGDFYADAIPFVDRAPQDVPDMEDPRPLPCPDGVVGPIAEVTFRLLAAGSQKGKVTKTTKYASKCNMYVMKCVYHLCIVFMFEFLFFCRIYYMTPQDIFILRRLTNGGLMSHGDAPPFVPLHARQQ